MSVLEIYFDTGVDHKLFRSNRVFASCNIGEDNGGNPQNILVVFLVCDIFLGWDFLVTWFCLCLLQLNCDFIYYWYELFPGFSSFLQNIVVYDDADNNSAGISDKAAEEEPPLSEKTAPPRKICHPYEVDHRPNVKPGQLDKKIKWTGGHPRA